MSDELNLENSSTNFLHNYSNNESFHIIFNSQINHYHHRVSSLFSEIILINNNFQVITSLILCLVGFIGGIFHLGIFFRRYFSIKSSSSHQIFIQSLFDLFHLINILFTHMIFIIVYIKTSQDMDLHCPLSTFVFSLASFGSICLLCLGAFKRFMYLFKKQSQYRSIRHRLLAHRIILITSLSWLIINCPKFDLKKHF